MGERKAAAMDLPLSTSRLSEVLEATLSVKKTLPFVVLAIFVCIIGTVLWIRSSVGPLAQQDLSHPRIYAYRDWQSIGVQVDPGDRIYIRAQGRWLYTPEEYHGPEGHREYRAPNTYPIPSIPGGILLMRVGEKGRIFPVGRGGTFVAEQSGKIYFRINDDILSDNEGYVTVEVEVTPAEELEEP
ncbi:MAG: hypothetical protein ACP5GX_07900 [Anaerolineae bacterium]